MGVLYAIPVPLFLVLGIAVCAGFAFTVHWALRRWVVRDDHAADNDPGFIPGMVGTLYAVVLGFITVAVWEQYDGTRIRLALETAAVTDAWHTAVGLPGSVRSQLRSDMLSYATLMAHTEWPMMRTGGATPEGDAIIMHAMNVVGSANVDARGASAQSITLALLNQLHDARLERIDANRDGGLSWLEWFVLFLGFAIVAILSSLYGVPNRLVHRVMIGAVATIAASMFVLIFVLQYPYRSGVAIDAQPWLGVIEHIGSMDAAHGPMNMHG